MTWIQKPRYLFISLLCMLLLAWPVAAEEPLGTLWDDTLPDIVYSAGVSADGALIVYGGHDGVLYARDRAGQELWQVELGSTIRYLSISSDGDRIAVATENRLVSMLDREGNILWDYPITMPPVGLGMSDDGATIAVGEERNPRITVIEGATGAARWEQDLQTRIEYTTVSGDGSQVYTGSRDARVNAYDAQTGEQLWSLMIDSVIRAIHTNPDGSFLLAGGDANSVNAIDTETGGLLWSFEAEGRIHSIRSTPDMERIAAASRDGNVYILNNLGELIQTIVGGSRVDALAMSADGSVVVAGTSEGRLFAVNLASARQAQAAQARNTLITLIVALVVVGALALSFARYVHTNPTGQQWWAPKSRVLRGFGHAVWKGKLGYLFMLPTMTLLLIFAYYPAVMGLALGFTEWRPGQVDPPSFVGLHNYQLVFRNPNTLAAARNNAIILVAGLIKTLCGPLIIAEMIFALSRTKTQYFWRVAFIVPLVVPGVATILMWNSIFDPNLGLINNTLFALDLAQPQSPPTWFGDRALALPSLIFIGFPWIGAFPLLIFYGGLITISQEIFDAAKVDGATGLQRFFKIDVPLLLPQIRLLTVLSVIGSLQDFGLILLTTQGGPGNSTTIPAYEMYMQGINSGRYGYAAALASILFAIIMTITIFNLRIGRKFEVT